jgi:hypothetical protein
LENTKSSIFNCYRAILAQVNSLDSFCKGYGQLKDLYCDLAELAYFIMEEDFKQVFKTIKQIHDELEELNEIVYFDSDNSNYIKTMVAEIITHLDFLIIEYDQRITN